MAQVIGIDLGTTNSAMAVMEAGEPVVVSNAQGTRTTPSVVAVTKSGERLVGQVAKRQAITNPENTIFSIKRFMGRKLNDPEVEADQGLVPYIMSASSNGDAAVDLGDTQHTPPEISAMILGKLKADAEAFLGDEVKEAVVTVPAYFNDAQRQATKDAGRIAGLDILRIVNEPTAAALAYGLDQKNDEVIAVYDLGGGTFDISILEIGDGTFQVLSTNGNTHLGGDDFDQSIIDWLVTEFQSSEGIDLKQDRQALQRLKAEAEKAKIELSSAQESEINLPFITADASGPKHLNLTLSRAKLEQLVADHLDGTLEPVKKALADAGKQPSEVDEIILVGGQTRMPAVQQRVQEFFEKEPHKGVNPDEVVAMGAAIQAGVLKGDVQDVLLLDVTPLTLGIETLGEVMTTLIPRNTTIPTEKSQVFSTAADNQASVEIHVLQGERQMANVNKSLGKFILDGIVPSPRGVPQIEVTFDIDANGIVQVAAKDKGTGKEQKITIQSSSGLTDDEIEKMQQDAELHAEEDEKQRERIELRNLADSTAYQAEKTVSENAEKIDEDLKNEVNLKVKALRDALEADDRELIQKELQELNDVLQRVGESVYADQAPAEGAPPGAAPNGAPPPPPENDADAGTVEGEFREV